MPYFQHSHFWLKTNQKSDSLYLTNLSLSFHLLMTNLVMKGIKKLWELSFHCLINSCMILKKKSETKLFLLLERCVKL